MSDDDQRGFAEYADRVQHTQEVTHHRFSAWLMDKSNEELVLSDGLLIGVDGELAAYRRGVIHGILTARGFCVACGNDHDPAVLLKDESNPQPEVQTPSDEAKAPETPRKSARALMEEYGVTLIETDPPKVMCLECQMIYPSIQDRMLRPPLLAGCTGCQYKSAHG